MTSACTILCPAIGFSAALKAIRSSCAVETSLEGTDEKWGQITLTFPGKRLTLSSLVRERPGDKFSKLVLSMHNFFRTIETAASSNKSHVLGRVENVKMMIGVVAEPAFTEDDDRFGCLWAIAESLDALIFNGEAMLDLQGQRILSRNGDYDVVV